jgi:glycosyltransferase involved in cell wall biosynthesis
MDVPSSKRIGRTVVSIVVPMYNSAEYLASTIESVRAQTFSEWEMILVDDGSVDDTVKVCEEEARRDARIRVVRAGHQGVVGARNRGLHETSAQSEFVAFLDSDDTYEPEALALLTAALETHPECPAAHGLARATDLAGKQFEGDDLMESMRDRFELRNGKCVPVPLLAPTSFEAELVKNYIVTPGTSLIRRRALDVVGEFDVAVEPADDWDINLRIARLGGFALVDHVILNWRRHAGSLSDSSRRSLGYAHFAVMKRAVRSANNTPQQRRSAEHALLHHSRAFRDQAGAALRRGDVRTAGRALIRGALYLWAYLSARGVRTSPPPDGPRSDARARTV